MKIKLFPENEISSGGVASVIHDHRKLLSHYEFVKNECDADIIIAHANSLSRECDPDIAWTHGIYPTSNPAWGKQFQRINEQIFSNIAKSIETVAPSVWGREVLTRYTGRVARVIHNGIFLDEYKKAGNPLGNILWPKTSINPTCDPLPFADMIKLSAGIPNRFAAFVDIEGAVKLPKMTRDDAKWYLSDCAIFVSTTKENDSVMLMEAMALGIPVLAYNWGMCKYRLMNGVGCVLVEPGDILGLVNGAKRILADWKRYSQRAKIFSKMFDIHAQLPEIEQLFDNVLREKLTPPSVSIIIPCYNYGHYLQQAIDSAKAQTIKCEVIVVDDASTDNTQVVARTTPDVAYIKNERNIGVARSRNKAIQQAIGTHIICLDADDVILPDYAKLCLDALNKSSRDTVITYAPLKVMDVSLSKQLTTWFTSPASYDAQKKSNSVPTNCMFSKKWWDIADGYDPLYNGCEDANLWLKMFTLGAKAIKVSSTPQTLYRSHPNSLSSIHRPEWNIYSKLVITHEMDYAQITIAINEYSGDYEYLASLYWKLKQDPNQSYNIHCAVQKFASPYPRSSNVIRYSPDDFLSPSAYLDYLCKPQFSSLQE
jgi:glycosyltransferase involved in cell wall biosynthesis